MKSLIVIFLVCGAAAIALLSNQVGNFVGALGSRQEEKQTADKGTLTFNPRIAIPRPFPAIKNINTQPVDRASQVLGDGELVLGVTIGERSRAYPITMLCGPTREIINDEIGGTKIAATW